MKSAWKFICFLIVPVMALLSGCPSNESVNNTNQKIEMIAADSRDVLLTIDDNQEIYEHIQKLHMDQWTYSVVIVAEAKGIYGFISYEEVGGVLTAVALKHWAGLCFPKVHCR